MSISRIPAACAALITCWSATAAGFEFVLKAEISQNEKCRLDWVHRMVVRKETLLVVSHRDGDINCFRRDEKTGEVSFLSAIDLNASLNAPTRHLDAFPVLSDRNFLYASGLWTHAGGNGDSIGLFTYKYNPEDGSATQVKHEKCDAGSLFLSANQKFLFLSACFSGNVQVFSIGEDGIPVRAGTVTGKGLGGELVPSADGKHLYSFSGSAVAWLVSKDDGSVAYGGSLDIPPELQIEGGVRARALAVSPDGKHAYAAVWGYKGNAMGLFRRDASTGSLAFAEKLDVPKDMFGITRIEFAPDGKIGFYSACPENPGKGLGAFSREPETGRLAFLAKAPRTAFGPGHFAYDHQSKTIYLAGTWSTKSFLVFGVR